ncbi:helix-turn-helix domain-containing protein [Microbulbifer epialgicus]|uniref:Helix-turn-helix domain-containing protein n=1 Tax=Microbulbifer epialgicus TaxID=393907 RepID=A0ABV4P1F5_9GAMM
MKKTRLPLYKIKHIERLHKEGVSQGKIAKEVKVSTSTVSKYISTFKAAIGE